LRIVTILLISVFIAVFCLLPQSQAAAQITNARNPQVVKILDEISATNIEATIRKLVSFKTRQTMSRTDSDTEGIGAARRWIKSEMERYSKDSGGRLKVEFQSTMVGPTMRIPNPTEVVNVVATLPGTQAESKDRIYVVGGHYDSIARPANDPTIYAPGANDDASGTAVTMELARVMSKYEFDSTLVFVTYAAEEQGLNGSAALAEKAKKENWNVGAVFNNDIVGNTIGGNGVRDNSHVRVFSEGIPRTETPQEARARQSNGGENDGPSRQLARYIKAMCERYVPSMGVVMVFRADRYGRGGDQNSWLAQGYPGVRFTEMNEDFTRQHQAVHEENGIKYGDVPEMVDFAYVAQVARVNGAAMASAALAPASPAGVAFAARGQEYDAELTWTANKEPDLAGYQVLVRTTTAPDWERKVWVGNVTAATMKGLSKDDYMFAVQAVDKDGNESIASFPKSPMRPPQQQQQRPPSNGNPNRP